MGEFKDTSRCELVKLVLIILGPVLFTALLIYLTWPPARYNPDFVLRDVTVYEFNATSPPSSGPPGPSYLNATMQVTLSSRNPNGHVGINYFTLSAYASYHGQMITPLTLMAPQAYQGHKEVIEWSQSLEGRMVSVYPGALARDLAAGAVPVDVGIDGRMKWEEGSWIYGLRVNCPALLMLNTSGTATGSGLSIEVQSEQHCTVDLVRERLIDN